MHKSNNNYLFISASISLILVAFFIALTKDKTDTLFFPKDNSIPTVSPQCTDVLKYGLSISISDSDATLSAILNNGTLSLPDILDRNSLQSLKNAAICLGRSPLEIDAGPVSKKLEQSPNLLTQIELLSKLSATFKNAIDNSTLFKNLDIKINLRTTLNQND